MFEQFLKSLLGCSHENMSRVWTINLRTYRVCLDCGLERDWHWRWMKYWTPPHQTHIEKQMLYRTTE